MNAGVDESALDERMRELAALMRTHAGGLELESVADDGGVRVRFTGMCCGCTFRPLTLAGTIRPALREVPGVTRVEVAGTRISEEAEQRLADALASVPNPWTAAR
jgi:Fe-S cluster biogenesis protein NfuA